MRWTIVYQVEGQAPTMVSGEYLGRYMATLIGLVHEGKLVLSATYINTDSK